MTRHIALLHGAGTGPWVWDRVLDRLDGSGAALAVPGRVPGATPAGCAAELVAELDRRAMDSVVLVLHSLSGVLAADLASLLGTRLANTIFVAAVIPPSGRSFVDAMPFPNRIILRLLFRLRSGGLKPSPAMIRRELCNDLSEADAEMVVSRYEAELPGLYLNPAGDPAPLAGSAYVKLSRDQSVTAAMQDGMIRRLPEARVNEIDAGHLAMLSAPGPARRGRARGGLPVTVARDLR